MTEPARPCIRGCVSPCNCDACKECNQPIHPPQHRPQETGLLCARCVKSLRTWLHDIPDLYATLDVTPQQTEQEGGTHQKISGSPALARLDIVALTDPRTSVTSITPPGETPEQWDGTLYVPGEVCSWAAAFTEEHGLASDVSTLAPACALLAAWLPTVAEMPWVDEFFETIKQCYDLLRHAHGEHNPRPIGRCINVYERAGKIIECKHMLYAPTGSAKIRCGGCGRRYDGYALIALGDSLGVGT